MLTLLTATSLWLGVHYAYVLAMSAKDSYETGRLTKYWVVLLLPALVLGVALDFTFNYTFGWMFLKVPRRYLFSQTVQYHYSNGDGWRLNLAQWWAKNLNVFDEHIKP